MKHKLIYTDNYILVVDDSEIKDGDYYLSKISDDVFRRAICGHWIENYDKKMYHKAIAHIPLKNSPILEGVPLLPPLEVEDDVEELAEHSSELQEGTYTIQHKVTYKHGFIDGYNKAKEKYRFTEEDMINAVLFGMQKGLDVGVVPETNSDWVRNYIQSLSQPILPKAFECEVEAYTVGEMSKLPLGTRNEKPKTTTNAQGQTEWVGKWIHE